MSVCPIISKQQALDKIAASLTNMAGLNEFMRLWRCSRRDCLDSVDGSTQLVDLNEYCLRHIREYLKISDIIDSPL